MRLLPKIIALGLACVPALCFAQTQVPAYRDVQGVNHSATGVVILNADGSLSGGASGSGATRGTITDGSGTIATGGTGQQVFAANAARNYVSCQNPPTTTEPLYYRFGATASVSATSKALQPGGEFTFSAGFVPSDALSVSAATAGHAFTCWQG